LCIAVWYRGAGGTVLSAGQLAAGHASLFHTVLTSLTWADDAAADTAVELLLELFASSNGGDDAAAEAAALDATINMILSQVSSTAVARLFVVPAGALPVPVSDRLYRPTYRA
jgi:hypothetical protein